MPDAWTITDLVDVRPIVVVPIGSWEQHGPHLPFDTDSVIATELVRRATESLSDVRTFVVPPINFSASGEHAGFPGTISIGGDTTTRTLVELARSCDWADGIVFVNGHGGNARAMRSAMDVIAAEGRRAASWSPTTTDPTDTHAGHVETSVMLAIDPARVRMDRARIGTTTPLSDIIGDLRDHGVRAVSDNGVLGDPTRANAEDGRSILDAWTTSLVDAIRTWVRGAR